MSGCAGQPAPLIRRLHRQPVEAVLCKDAGKSLFILLRRVGPNLMWPPLQLFYSASWPSRFIYLHPVLKRIIFQPVNSIVPILFFFVQAYFDITFRDTVRNWLLWVGTGA